MTPVPAALLQGLAHEAEEAVRPFQAGLPAADFDLEAWIEAHRLDVEGPEAWKGGKRWIFRTCPWNSAHTNRSAYITQLPNGAIAAGCHHNGCGGKNWQALRDLVEPGWRSADQCGDAAEMHRGGASWESPIPFHQFKLPSFPTLTFPGWLREFVEAEATATQTPVDLAAMLALSVVAAACAKKVIVQVKTGYHEPVNIFTVTSLSPGNRKTAVFAATTKPLEDYEYSEAKRTAGEIAQAKTAYKIKESTLKRLQEQAARATGAKREALTQEAGALAAELEEIQVSAPTRCIVDDCTPEKLASLLRDQSGRIAVMSPEGDVFDLMAGRYSSNSTTNFAVYLKGHAGDTLRVDRVGRAPEFVKAPALTVGLAVQPEVIRGLAEKPGFRGRGLLGRFLYALPVTMLGRRDTDPPPVPETVYIDYHNNVLALLNTAFAKDETGEPCAHILTFDADGRDRLRTFAAWLEPQLSEFGELGGITDWGGKIAGAVARIAALLHMADLVGTDNPWNIPIPGATVERAIAIGEYSIPHAKAAFAEMGADEVVERAKAILRWLMHKGLASFAKRDVHQGMRGTFTRATDVDAPLAMLVERGYIRKREENFAGGPGRHPSPTYDVNPRWVRQNTQSSVWDGHSEYCEDSETVPRQNPIYRQKLCQPIANVGLE